MNRFPAHRLLVLTAIALLSLVGVGSPSRGQPGGPSIRFEGQKHDFGEMTPDEQRSHQWIFYNDGDEPLQVFDARSSCGCTASVATSESIAPGQQGVLDVRFDAAGQYGTVRKTITVMSNDPARPRVKLTIIAKVARPEPEIGDENGHPPIVGQSMLVGECASCHAAPAMGKQDQNLYDAVCQMCHGDQARGTAGRAPSLLAGGFLADRSDEELKTGIAYGTANPQMPGFSEMMGGPLNDHQIDSLVRLLRSWELADQAGDR